MPMKEIERRKRSPLKVIERDFNEAIDRLLAKKPTNRKLRQLAQEHRLNITPTTVALEAGRSRTLIALENCRLPAVRNRILIASRADEVVTPRTAAEVIIRLREQVINLKRELAAALDGQAKHFLAKERSDREAAKWRDAMRLAEAHAIEDAKITPIRGKNITK